MISIEIMKLLDQCIDYVTSQTVDVDHQSTILQVYCFSALFCY